MNEREIHLVRHGETDWNRQFRVQGNTDISLSPEGLIQAQKLAEQLVDIKFDRAYTSMLSRAIQTAEEALLGFDVPIHRHPGLNERKYGEYEGRVFSDIEEEFGKGALNLRHPLGGETTQEFVERVNSTFDEILALHPEESLLIISHGGVIRELNQRLNMTDGKDDEIGYEIANCSVITHTLLYGLYP